MKTTLDELQTFIAVVDAGTISRASERLEQTVSATSRALSRLEQKLETTLLRRTTRRLELTEEGESFLQRAREIVNSVESAEEQMAVRRRRPAGRLRVDASTPLMLHVIVPLVAGYCARYPEVELELHSNEDIVDLIERRIDLAFRIGPLKDSTLHATPLGSSRLRIQASHGYLAKHGRPSKISELQNHILLGFSQADSLNDWPLAGVAGAPLRIRPNVRSSSGETLRSLALNDAGIVCLSDYLTRRDRENGQLCELFASKTMDMRRLINAVYYRNTVVAAKIKSFVDYVKAQLRKHPAW